MTRRATGAMLLLAVAVAGVACSSDAAPPADTSSSSSTTTAGSSQPLSARGAASFGGALEASGDYEVLYSVDVLSCESRVTAPTYVIPLPGRLGDTRLQWQAALPELQGPGTYGLADLAGLQVTVSADGSEVTTVYRAGEATIATLELTAEGGGTFTFSGLQDATGLELHGTATWTCGPDE